MCCEALLEPVYLSVPSSENFNVNTEPPNKVTMSNLSKGGPKKDTKMRIRAFPVSTKRRKCPVWPTDVEAIVVVGFAG